MRFIRRPGSGPGDDVEPVESAQPEVVQAELVPAKESNEADLPPSRMRGTEPLYGYVVALELIVVAILNVVVTGGKGAPVHPQTGLQIIGIIAPLVFVAVLQLRNRTAAGFAAIVAAFFVTLPKVPNSLAVAHVFALIVPLAYGLIITQRQRRALSRAGGPFNRRNATRGARSQDARAGQARPERRRGRKGKERAAPSGPRPSARYTPPKAKRGQARR